MTERHSLWMASLSALAIVCFTGLAASFFSIVKPVSEDLAAAQTIPVTLLGRMPAQGGTIKTSLNVGTQVSVAAPASPAEATAEPEDDGRPIDDPEAAFEDALQRLADGDSRDALRTFQALARQRPEFPPGRALAHSLAAAISPEALAANTQPDYVEKRSRELVEEGRMRLLSEQAVPPEGTVPNALLQLADIYRHVLVVDLRRARLYVMENQDGTLKLVRQQYASMGKNGAGKELRGDNRTPIGIYHITRWIRDNALPELYGAGAWPTNYPNPWDVFKRRTGSGIWLHGVPRDTESRAPLSSEGCVTMANDDLLSLTPYVTLGQTPVVLSNELEWVKPASQREDREAFLARIEDWRSKWSAKDTDGYLAFYGEDFTAEGMNRREFGVHKHRVNAGKKFIEVQLTDINLFRYPGAEEPLMLAEFMMSYRSSNYSMRARKQQFWKQDAAGEWKIFREENL
jgi:murein L,D-transpeptidase YafK